jgi:hypothetical protein
MIIRPEMLAASSVPALFRLWAYTFEHGACPVACDLRERIQAELDRRQRQGVAA